MTGGTDRVRYALIAGYVGGSGFETSPILRNCTV